MNTKRLAALLTLGALLSTAAPAMAVTQTGTVQVEWNYAITATLTMFTQTTASQTHTIPASNDIYWASDPAGGAGTCNGGQVASKDPGVNLVVNFGSVSADPTDYTNCLETNAIDAYYVTNDSSGADFTVQATLGVPSDYDTATNGSLLCIEPDGWTAGATGGATAWTTSARAAAISMNSTTACSAGLLVPKAAAVPLYNLNANAPGNDLNQDVQLNMGPQMQSGNQTVTLTYTMVTN